MNKKIFQWALVLPASALPALSVLSCTDNATTENKSEVDLLKDHLKELKWQQKEGVNLDQIASSTIKTEADLLTYFDLVNKNETKYSYQFRSVQPEADDVGKLKVEYQVILLAAPNSVRQTYRATLTGFRSPSAISAELEQIGQKATFDVANKERLATTVQANEIK